MVTRPAVNVYWLSAFGWLMAVVDGWPLAMPWHPMTAMIRMMILFFMWLYIIFR